MLAIDLCTALPVCLASSSLAAQVFTFEYCKRKAVARGSAIQSVDEHNFGEHIFLFQNLPNAEHVWVLGQDLPFLPRFFCFGVWGRKACLTDAGNASACATSPWGTLAWGDLKKSRAVAGGADSATGASLFNFCMRQYCQQSEIRFPRLCEVFFCKTRLVGCGYSSTTERSETLQLSRTNRQHRRQRFWKACQEVEGLGLFRMGSPLGRPSSKEAGFQSVETSWHELPIVWSETRHVLSSCSCARGHELQVVESMP